MSGKSRLLGRVIVVGLAVPDHAVEDLAGLVRAAGADDLADRLREGRSRQVQLLALAVAN